MLYARLNPDTGLPEVRDLAQPPTGKRWVPLVIDAQPVPSATQVVIDAGIVFSPTEAHQTWALREMTATEAEAADLQTEKAQLDGYLTDIKTQLDVTNAMRGAMTNGARLNELEKDTRVLLKSVKFLLRQAKRNI